MENLKHFDLFSGYGGFSLALDNIYAHNSIIRTKINGETNFEKYSSLLESGNEERRQRTINNNEYVDVQSSEGIQQREFTKSENMPNSREQQLGTKSFTIGFSEIDKYASSVLKYHWPKIKNYGDISKINWSKVPNFDIVTGGSPCQDLSVAGKQKGLAGERSGLFFQYIRCLKEKQPDYFIWENVKGALSSTNGWDFARVQIEFSEAGYNVWWQVLNAKDFNIPQNRERIFAVGVRRGSSREIFFEKRNSGENIVENDAAEIYKQTQKLSDAFRIRSTEGVSATLKGLGGGMGAKTGLYAVKKKNNEFKKSEDICGCLDANYFKGLDYHQARTGIAVPILEATKKGYALAEVGDSVNISVLGSKTRRGRVGKKIAQTLDTGSQQCTVTAVPLKFLDRNQKNYQGEYSFTIDASQTGGIMQNCRIRRLTPTECERLMGLPDDWLKYGIDEKGNKTEISDSQKYKMAGNGVVVPVVEEVIKNLIL